MKPVKIKKHQSPYIRLKKRTEAEIKQHEVLIDSVDQNLMTKKQRYELSILSRDQRSGYKKQVLGEDMHEYSEKLRREKSDMEEMLEFL